MKTILLLILFVLFFYAGNSQNIIGRWQANTALVGEESDDNYQFFADGTFRFNLDGEGKLVRVSQFGGTYKVMANKIILTPSYYVEETGGYLTRTGAEPGTAEWAFVNAKYNKVQLEKTIKQELPFKVYKNKNSTILEIDSAKFYKIQSDPQN